MMVLNNSFHEVAAAKVWNTAAFQNEFSQLYFSNVYYSFLLEKHKNIPSEAAVIRLLNSAAILALSDVPEHRKAAYRIVVSVLNLFRKDYKNLANILHVILARLGNFPAADFMFKTLREDKSYSLPSSLLYELLGHENKNTVSVADKKIVFTDFQIKLWEMFNHGDNVSVSAPTSAGKSFALQHYLINQIALKKANLILYLVPTRVLIGQVSEAISNMFKGINIDLPVIVIPETREQLNIRSGVYVLTQERAHALLELDKDITFDVVVIDEAQTIAAGARGILLQVVIEKLISKNKTAKFFFGSPFSSNPLYFSCLFDAKIDEIKEEESPVSQNLIGADISVEDNKTLSLKLYEGTAPKELATIKLDQDINDEKAMFAYLCHYLGRKSKNIVYAGSQAACEDIADKIRQWIDQSDEDSIGKIPDDVKELASFIRDHIHPKYFLADMIERGVAFHYGRMPAVLRKAIEEHFSNHPHMQFLVCTSTLLHGVNLPAKNLFLLKPSEGDKWLSKAADSISSPSFWNLAGRAGRLGKDFEGNVFLVNKSQWKTDPLEGNREQSIKASFYSTVQTHQDDILRLARSEIEALDGIDGGDAIESAFVKLYTDFKKEKLEKVFERSPEKIDTKFQSAIMRAFEGLSFSVPDNIIENNIGISPHRQQKMLKYMTEAIYNDDSQKLIPLHPEANAYQSYVRLFSRYETKFGNRPVASQAPKRLAAIALSWMKGTPYPLMIKKQEELSKSDNLPMIIRNTMETIENDLRFKCVQNTKCYIDLLKYSLTVAGLEEKCPSIPALPLYLEVGASSGTMINLIGMGFTRTTAGLINKKASNRNMDRANCKRWLSRENWESSDLPRVCKNEIRFILGGKKIHVRS